MENGLSMSIISVVMIVIGVIGFFLMMGVAFGSTFTVEQQEIAIVQRFGKFYKTCGPGLNFKVPFFDRVVSTMSLKVIGIQIKVETKTKDNVFVTVHLSIQYSIIPDKVKEAYYRWTNPAVQMTAYVLDAVRSQCPKTNLDDLFERKDEIATVVKQHLDPVVAEYGYQLLGVLVVDIDPDAKVKAAMNEINAQTRLRIAATEKGEADRIMKVAAATAEAQSKALQGKGIADQRAAIVNGLKASVEEMAKVTEGGSNEVLKMILLTQYFDVIKEIGSLSKTTVLLVPHSPSSVNDLADQLRNTFLVTDAAKEKPEKIH